MTASRAPYETKPLRLLLVAAIALPCAIMAYSAWRTHGRLVEARDERLGRALDVVQEHALKVLQTTDRLLLETDRYLGPADAVVRASEEERHRALKEIQSTLPEVEAIWAFAASGRPLVSSTIYPVPQTLNNSDRSYFDAHSGPGATGLYVSENVAARIGNGTFFVVSRRRSSLSGEFNGVVALTLPPTTLNNFYEKLTRGTPIAAALLREDGRLLARHPAPPAGFVQARATAAFAAQITRHPEAGTYVTVSGLDETERSIVYRRVPGYPLYVTASYDLSAFRRAYAESLLSDLVVGGTITALFVLLIWLALRRTEALRFEFARREKAEQTLKEGQRLEALGQLTGGVAHDFNNLLMVVRGNAERLSRGLPADRQKRAIRAIVDATATGEKLTRQLLTFSRRQRVSPEVVDLETRLKAIEELLGSSLRGDISIRVQVSPGTWPIYVDVAEFELAVLNLAINARDAMSGQGTVTVAAANADRSELPAGLAGEFVHLNVQDSGGGIPPEILPKVFDPFFTTKPVGKGTGLGLSQVYGFALQAGGMARIASAAGEGTTVSLFLPRAGPDARSAPTASSAIASPVAQGRALLVEDNGSVAEVAVEHLRECGYEVTHVSNGADAVTYAERGDALDLVLSDIVMPGQASGLDLARHLRRSRPDLRVILATGYSEAALSARSEGFQIISKPYSLDDLRAAIARRDGERLAGAAAE